MNRKSDESDKTRYQTVYSKIKGSLAAPTAGLHFTKEVFADLQKNNVKTTEVTLHVGAGTFKPVKSETSDEHEMHTEHFSVNRDNLRHIAKHLKNITAVGTTTVRTLESLYRIGVKLILNISNAHHISQKEVYHLPENIKPADAFRAVEIEMDKQTNYKFSSTTKHSITACCSFYKRKSVEKYLQLCTRKRISIFELRRQLFVNSIKL